MNAIKIQRLSLQKIIFVLGMVLSITPFVSPPIALVSGFLLAQIFGNPFLKTTQKLIHLLLKISVVGLGFGMNIASAMQSGKEGFSLTILSIFSVLVLGYVLTRFFKIDLINGYLISVGTAICGGSAIAAISPVIKAKPNQISVSLAIVFALNSIALLVFPSLGHLFSLSSHDFGLWCAIAIHDTSSVVGAASKYSSEALQVATVVKLTRALWIIPVTSLSVILFKNKNQKVKIPYFIGLFVIAMALNSYFPIVHQVSPSIVAISKAGLTLTLFLIGAGLSFTILKNVGFKPILLALLLWIFIASASLVAIINHIF